MTPPTDPAAFADEVAARLAPLLRPRGDLLTAVQAGERLGVSERTIREMQSDGRLRGVLVTGAARRYEPEELDALVEARKRAERGEAA